jgi:hypothetical protein
MLLHLPQPYEDELLYSVFARFFAHHRPGSHEVANLTLFGKKKAFSVGFGANLDSLSKDISQNPKGLSRMVHGDIAKEFIKFFGTKFLTKLGCKFSQEKIRSYFRTSSSASYHPLVHVLVQKFLESRVGSPPLLYQNEHGALEKRWKCPNPYARHKRSFRIPTITPRKTKDGERYWSAKCTCGYCFSFSNPAKDDQCMPEVSSSFAHGPAFATHAKKLKSDGVSLRRIAKMMSISSGLVERLIAGRSNLFEVSRDEIKSLRDRWVRERCKNAYARLYRHDKTWLMKQTKRSGR